MNVKSKRDAPELVRPDIRALPPYTLDRTPCRFKLDQNEVPWDFPRRLKRRVGELLAAIDWSRYPDFHADDLRRDLGALHGWPVLGSPRTTRRRVAAILGLRDGLAARGILVRDVGAQPGLAGCLRFSVGNSAALRATERALIEMEIEMKIELEGAD